MRLQSLGLLLLLAATANPGARPQEAAGGQPRGTHLEELAWPAAAERLKEDTVVLLAAAGAAVQHGPHLPLGTDVRIAGFLLRRIGELADAVILPPLTYGHAPAFDEYPGSTSLSFGTARDAIVDAVRSVSRHGPRRFYLLESGVPSAGAAAASARVLASEGILLRHADVHGHVARTAPGLQQPTGLHADELETSLMLYIDPSSVEMNRAVKDMGPPSEPFRLTRLPGARGTYSPTGIWGDPTLATAEKGRSVADALVVAMHADIETLRRAPVPAPAPGGGMRVAAEGRGTRAPGEGAARGPDECLPGDEAAIRRIGPRFESAWRLQDASRLAELWMPNGNMIHPDGFAERSAFVIRQNRRELFSRAEYRNSRHSLQIGEMRCLSGDVAVADGKWELRGVVTESGGLVQAVDGLFTLVLRRTNGAWLIEAYRYSMTPRRAPGPVLLDRPGAPEIIRE